MTTKEHVIKRLLTINQQHFDIIKSLNNLVEKQAATIRRLNRAAAGKNDGR